MRSLASEVDRLQRNLDTASRQSENLQAALESNRRIGMAIGILMVTRQLTDDAAFDCLRQVSNQRNVKLRLVAEEVIYRGALD
ncbi:ANTAR domain-containing protein [Geodermatophilus siccatus]|nr:ANTAR domain-containing protein [Geodermatophilus siccatus]